jgi:Helicase conserved C-terminal domain
LARFRFAGKANMPGPMRRLFADNLRRRVLFLTGTPMENRVEEFRALVGHLRPEIAATVTVYAGKFMAMRRAAFAPGTAEDSAKLRRLVEIAEEAIADGHKVVVFSFFRDVLGVVAAALGPNAVGPLTGSVPPSACQAMVDEFTARARPAVLVSQIQAGGVGLNIQAASVVIITEPQWTPAIEEQAIARCHRMGQVRRVDVHRLLTEDGVDQRMLEILRVKADEFNEYGRRSDLKDITPDAVDISDLTAAAQVASQAESERRIVEMERKGWLTLAERSVQRSPHPAHSMSRPGSQMAPMAARATSSDRSTLTPRIVAWVTPEPRTASRWFTSERSDGYTSEACRGPCPG